jgi:hypothetical protein
MANALYDSGRGLFLAGSLDWDAHAIHMVLTDHGTDTPNVATDDFRDDISAGTIATSGAFSGKTTTAGVADMDDVTFTAVSGASVESCSSYRNVGTAATDPLIAYVDTATGLPVTPSGGDIVFRVDSGSNRYFKL